MDCVGRDDDVDTDYGYGQIVQDRDDTSSVADIITVSVDTPNANADDNRHKPDSYANDRHDADADNRHEKDSYANHRHDADANHRHKEDSHANDRHKGNAYANAESNPSAMLRC